MTVNVIKCESPEEAILKAEAFKDITEDQIIVVDNYFCTGKPGEWFELTQSWDGAAQKYKVSISSNEEEKKKTEEWIEDFEAKTKVT